jgi:hypothetical protein
MILTKCAVCATELGLSLGKKCGRCSTRYCGAECQVQHWKEGGHDTLCKPIKKAGGAEQYHANKKYAEAVTIAAEACAEDTKGQTCYICTQALHWKTKEGLVRMCACRGTAGFAHVSCLAEQAKILCAEAWENHLGIKMKNERWDRWHTCSLCEQKYHGVVRCALGWACWKTYLGQPESDHFYSLSMTQLGNGLSSTEHHEQDALSVREAELAIKQRVGLSQEDIRITQNNLAMSYACVGRLEDASRVQQEVYSGRLKLYGTEHEYTVSSATNYARTLLDLQRFGEVKSLLRKLIPVARRVIGETHILTLKMRRYYAESLYSNDGATLDDLREAVTTLEELTRTARRVFGETHPDARGIECCLEESRAALRARERGMSSLSEAFAAMTPSPRV